MECVVNLSCCSDDICYFNSKRNNISESHGISACVPADDVCTEHNITPFEYPILHHRALPMRSSVGDIEDRSSSLDMGEQTSHLSTAQTAAAIDGETATDRVEVRLENRVEILKSLGYQEALLELLRDPSRDVRSLGRKVVLLH